ncbi:MAG: hypothetical protein HZA94_03410 [Candidatus Vogelbacteria bacterium]|nr:hypothetical protein [Candidatus Vogelbacteria bacterium]
MYNVVFRTIAKCETTGAVTWSSYKSKEEFEALYDEGAKKQEEVVAEGVSEEQAVELCSSPEATLAREMSLVRRNIEELRRFLGMMRLGGGRSRR